MFFLVYYWLWSISIGRWGISNSIDRATLYGRKRRYCKDQVDGLETVPILKSKYYDAPSVFTPENLLREARRQKGLTFGQVPSICILDPDGDLVDYLHATGHSRRHPAWACYHTTLDTFVYEEIEFGVIGRVVGASLYSTRYCIPPIKHHFRQDQLMEV